MEKIKAKANIRRYDVFAVSEYVKNIHKGIQEDISKGDAIWLATLVAARKFSKGSHKPRTSNGADAKSAKKNGVYTEKWRYLGDVLQTDKLYDQKIVERMGKEFYENEFLPAIEKEVDLGHEYKDYRDSIRMSFNG